MTPSQERYYIAQLVQAVSNLGPDFEAFGARFVDHVHGGELLHRGQNIQGSPVGYVVDTMSHNGDFVAEYSAEAGYFSGKYSKPAKDWKHVCESVPHVKEVWLVSSREMGPQATTRLGRFVARVQRRRGIRLRFWGAREIAETIVRDLLLSDSAVQALSPYLATLQNLVDESVLSQQVPKPSEALQVQPDLERVIIERLEREQVVGLAGLSGSGKSEAAAAVARVAADRYDLVVWLPTPTALHVSDLTAVEVERLGRRMNVLGLLRARRCLLILDDLRSELSVAGLRAACGPGSGVLITRQLAGEGDIPMPLLEEAASRLILEHGTQAPCPDDLFFRIWRTVGGHPLTLKLLNSSARDGGWQDVEADLEDVERFPEPERRQKLWERLLERVRPMLSSELTLFRWCASSRVDREFAKAAILPRGVRLLQQANLLAPSRYDILRLHDIIVTSLAALEPPSEQDAARFSRVLEQHVTRVALSDESGIHLRNLAYVHRDLFERLAKDEPEQDAWLYCLLHAWDIPDIELDVIGDPIRRAQRFTGGAPAEVSGLSVLTVLEAEEAVYRAEKRTLGPEAARAARGLRLEVFDLLEAANGISAEAWASVQHHRAKALSIVGRDEEARAICEDLLARGNAFPAVRLLLARILKKSGAESKREQALLLSLLEETASHPESVGISVTLAATSDLRGRDLIKEASERYRTMIADRIIAAGSRGFEQAFLAFAAIGSHWRWTYPELFMEVFRELPPRVLTEDLSDEQLAAWGSILLDAQELMPAENQQAILSEAVSFYNAIRDPSPFVSRYKAKALRLDGHLEEALDLLTGMVRDGPDAWNLHEYSKALHVAGRHREALEVIDRALAEIVAGRAAAKYEAAFLEHRFAIRLALGEADAVEDLRTAYDVCADAKYRVQIGERLALFGWSVTFVSDGT